MWSKFLLLTVKTVQVSFIHRARCKAVSGDGFEVKQGKFSKCKVFLHFTPPLHHHLLLHLHLPSREVCFQFWINVFDNDVLMQIYIDIPLTIYMPNFSIYMVKRHPSSIIFLVASNTWRKERVLSKRML